ncbi:MAG: lipoyl(octanoyl) transferase LipB [Chitinophagales bacterium]|nr:lipoyl(octanoyl) transferase LipB [Chitinophagales bacterium]
MIRVPVKYFLVSPYSSVLRYQQTLFDKAVATKETGGEPQPTLIICQHHPVYTLGKSGKRENLLTNPETIGAEYVEINRGGDITFHGPGQMVVYPIWDLDTLQIGVAQYVFNLEQTVIETLHHFGIEAARSQGEPGVWVDNAKIAAIGIKISRHITMHGMALNINTDLSYFKHIVPCGISNKEVTSMAQIAGNNFNVIEVVNIFKQTFEKVFKVTLA